MGKKYVIDESTLTNIADSIRSRMGWSQVYTPEDIPYGVSDIYNLGFNDGYSDGEIEGYNKGHPDGYSEGHAQGRKAEHGEFWDSFQNYGKRTNYWYGFFTGDYVYDNPWNKITLKPKYDLIPTNSDRMFYRVREIEDLEKHLTDIGVKLDFSKSTTLNSAFCYGSWVIFHTIDCSNATTISAMCNYCYSLETIEKWIMSEKVTTGGKCFVHCTKLKNIIAEGVIAISISFSDSPLTVESMISIITHLKDCSGTSNAGAYTLTLKDSCKTLMAEQGTIEELGGKTYDQYITDIGWNLA